MAFIYPQKVLFKHCDPAGIVFFPRYMEMLNDGVEALFSQALGWAFEDLHPDHTVPTAALNVEFKAPSRHGDQLELKIAITAMGRASLTLKTGFYCHDDYRVGVEQTLVCVGPAGKPVSWPERVRDKANQLMEQV